MERACLVESTLPSALERLMFRGFAGFLLGINLERRKGLGLENLRAGGVERENLLAGRTPAGAWLRGNIFALPRSPSPVTCIAGWLLLSYTPQKLTALFMYFLNSI